MQRFFPLLVLVLVFCCLLVTATPVAAAQAPPPAVTQYSDLVMAPAISPGNSNYARLTSVIPTNSSAVGTYYLSGLACVLVNSTVNYDATAFVRPVTQAGILFGHSSFLTAASENTSFSAGYLAFGSSPSTMRHHSIGYFCPGANNDLNRYMVSEASRLTSNDLVAAV